MKTSCFALLAGMAAMPFAAHAQTAGSPAVAPQPTGTSVEPAPQPAAAPAGGSGQLQDIIVTARRTSEKLQDVPVSVTGFSQQQLKVLNIQNFGDIGKTVPNLDVQRQFGSASAPQFFLRGIATGSLKFETDAGIGLYVDGVYLGRPAGAAFDLAEIERVEVLRGPQGTLFGRNSTGGAINYITPPPTGHFGVSAEGTVGNYDRRSGRVTVNLPSVGPLSARVSYLHGENTGYVKNLTPGRTFNFAQPFGVTKSAETFGAENTDAVAVAVRLDLSPFVVDYKFDWTDKISTQLGQQLLGFNPSFAASVPFFYSPPSVVVGPSTTRQSALALDMTTPSRLRIQGHSLTASYAFSDAFTIKNIAAYRTLDEFVGGNDIDGGALSVGGLSFTTISSLEDRHQKQYSDEFQLLGKIANLEYVVGGFYFQETGSDNNPVFIGDLFPPGVTLVPRTGAGTGTTVNIFGVPSDYFAGLYSKIRNESVAGYAHLAWKMDHFELAGGVRYSKDNRRENIIYSAATPGLYKYSGDHWDFDATASYIFNRNVRAYARFATGYLSGGVLNGVQFKNETIKNYEIGLKGDFLDKTFRANIALFHADRRNLQTLEFSPATGTYLVSSPTGHENGVELELTALPTRGLQFGASFGYLENKLAPDPINGPVVSQAPKFTVAVNAQYDAAAFENGSHLMFRFDGNFKDKRYSDPILNPATSQLTILPSRFDMSARVSLLDLPIGGYKTHISGWVQNLSNNKKLEFARDLGTAIIGVYQVPRTYGLDFGVAF